MDVRINKLNGTETVGKVDHEHHVELFLCAAEGSAVRLLTLVLPDGVAWRLYTRLSQHFSGRPAPTGVPVGETVTA